MGMGFQFEQHRLGLWDLSWDLKKTISWEMGLGPPPSRPSVTGNLGDTGNDLLRFGNGKTTPRTARGCGLRH